MDPNGLSILNPNPIRLPGPTLLHELIASPSDSTALEYLNESRIISYSYRDLHDAADILAARLSLARGHVEGPFVVPVLIRQSPQLYIAFFILKDISATVIVVSEELESLIPYQGGGVQVLLVDGKDSDVTLDLESVNHRIPTPNDLAYVMYTSGSTGVPKGVGISHLAVSQALLAHDRHIPAFSRFLQFAAPTFDVSVFEIFFPWFRSCTLICVSRDELLNDLPTVLQDMRIDACELTPTVAASLLRRRENAPNLKLLLTIGEMLNVSVVEEFGGDDDRESLLWAMYGPTEATIHCTLQEKFSSKSSRNNIGVPLDTVSCFVIEPAEDPKQSTHFNLLPRGEVGELAVGGHQLADGYVNRPEQTSSAFISSPYGRVYRTGDKARINADGTLECLGRLSEGQVKLRGQRLELGEVEAAVLRTPGCHGAVAAVVDSILVVFCAIDDGVSEEAIMGCCRRWLPQFMVPGGLVLLEDFPRLPSGKVDRKKLQADYQMLKSDILEDDEVSEIFPETEELILSVISEALDLEVNKRMTLASAGVDSLKAIKVASSLRASGFEMSAAKLLMLKNISDILVTVRPFAKATKQTEGDEHSLLEDLHHIAAGNAALEQVRGRVEDILPCSPLQTALLAETARHPEAYWNEIELEADVGITADQLSSAIHELTTYNEILRAGFVQWKSGLATVIFGTFDKERINIVDSFHHPDISSFDELLYPFRVQIQDGGHTDGAQVLMHVHHAIYDGWSMDIMWSDLSKLLGGAKLLPRQQFRSLIKFSQNISISQSDDDKAFWSDYLLDWNKPLFPKLSVQAATSSQTMVKRDILDIPVAFVNQVAQETDCSAQVYFQAAVAIVWGGIVGSSDVLIGSVTSGRTLPIDGIEGILGPFIASMPLRVDLDKSATALEVLMSIKSDNRKITEHSTLPLLEIRKLIGGQNADSLYDVLFVYQQSLYTDQRKENLVKETRHLDRLETKLLFEVEPHDDCFTLQATYHSASFPLEVVDHLVEQIKEVFGHLLSCHGESISSLRNAIRTKQSVHNEIPEVFNEAWDLATLFEDAAARNPDADAICFSTSLSTIPMTATTMSFGALSRHSNQIANLLLDQGAEPGQAVAAIMEKSPLLYASILGVAKAGCAYLPLLPSTPMSQVQAIFASAKTAWCLIDKSSAPAFQGIKGVQFVDIESYNLDFISDQSPNIPVDNSRLAYVTYTSGTNGVPKGVSVTQKNIVSNVLHLGSTFPTAQNNLPRFLQTCSQASGAFASEIFLAWHMEMCLYAASDNDLFVDLERAIRQFRITHLSLTPSIASFIDPRNVPDIEYLVTAGEPMTASVLDRWSELLWQGYGTPETTNMCSVKRIKHGEHIEHLGRVFPNTSVFVTIPGSLEIVPIGWVGEFCFGGDQIAAGYLNMPELTAEKFANHSKFGRIYRSGDVGRMLPDGSLIILGQLDDRLNLGGQRIETAEVTRIITGTSLAVEAVTMVIRPQSGSPDQLVSFYVGRKSDGEFRALEIDAETHYSLLAQLLSRLPAYMIPSYLVHISRMPLTLNGKVDRQRLRSMFETFSKDYLKAASNTTVDQQESKGSEIESLIADIIAGSLNIPRSRVGRWTPFAKLGLESISAIGVARDLSLQLNARVAVSTILQNPTVSQLGRCINVTPLPNGHVPTSYFSESFLGEVHKDFKDDGFDVAEVLPCSPLQEAMLSHGQDSYYNKTLLRLHIEPDEMRHFWDAIVTRHDILRTCFVTTSDSTYPIAQVVLSGWTVSWKHFNVNALSLHGAIHDHLKCLPDPLDTKTPPLSLAIIQNKGSRFLSFICHHALYDGVAMEVLWREVETLAHGNTLPPQVPYRPFLQEMLTLPNDTEQFWGNNLRRFSTPGLFAQPSRGHIVQSLHTSSLDVPYNEVQNRIRSLGTSLLSICQAAWAQVLSACLNTPDICFGCVMSGRTLGIDGLDRLVAPCFNTIPVRQDLSVKSQNGELAKSFQRLNSDLLRYQFTPLRLIQKVVGSQGRKLFDTLLILQQPLQNMDDRIWTLEEDSGEMDIPVVCEVVPCPGLNSVVVNMHYHMGIVDEDAAAALSDAFKHFFRVILDSPAAVADRNSLPPATLSSLVKLTPRQKKIRISDSNSQENEKWSESETRVRRVLSDLSGTPIHKVRRDTSIFQLGLDSINAVQVASILRRQGFAVSASDVVECQNCRKLAEKLAKSQKADLPRPSYDLDKFSKDILSQEIDRLPQISDVEAILPCTPIQCAMLTSFTQSHGEHYLNMASYAIDEGVTKSALTTAWHALRTRHPMLRAGFLSVQHKDSSFAMVRYRDTASIVLNDQSIRELEESIDLIGWKRDAALDILDALHLPPWRIAIASKDGGLSVNVSTRPITAEVPPVEPALQAILVESLKSQNGAQNFWTEKAEGTVVNTFPIMTPLREDHRTILSHEATSAIKFSLLQSATQQQGVSIQAIIQAAWTRVLSSYLGEDSVVFGVTLSGRTTDETKDAPFPCLTTVPIITTNQASNRRLVNSMMQYNKDLHKHQFAPLGQVQKWLGHPATPVFDTLLVYQKLDKDQTLARPWRLINDDANVDYPISLEIEPMGNQIRLCVTFFSDVLPLEQAKLLVGQFDAMMAHIATKPDDHEDGFYYGRPDIFAVTPPAMPVIPAPVEFLHQFVEERALSHPHDIALEFVGRFEGEIPIKQTWTYAEFDAMGNRVANMLTSEATVRSIVAIHFDKCPEAYISILGILKAGCSFAALDPSAPKSRKEFIMSDSKAPCLLTSTQTTIDFDASSKLIRIDLEKLNQYSPEQRDLGAKFTPDATCYCLYTSGTTGTPKGCEITHENCVQGMMAFQDMFKGHWQDDSRCLQFAALHFDVSVLEQYWSWSVGITVVAAPRDVILDDLIASINRLGITHIDLTPSLARLTHPDEVPGLCKGVFITGGESLKQEILDAWGPKAVIYNAYGPTEATIGVTMYQRVPINGRPSNIGKQFLNVGSYVFRKGTEIPVLRGAVGELCVSGKLVGKGYLNRQELTEERFPTLSEFDEKIYRTGDLVRILHDGCFDFLGRADDQVKLRGQRLEIGEINHVIRTGAPEIKDVATIVMRHGSGGKDVLVSFLVGKQERKGGLTVLDDDDELGIKARTACRAKLPGYMIPTYFLVLPYIPLSPNNKVESKELKQLFNGLSHEQLMALTAIKSSSYRVDTVASRRVMENLAEFCQIDENSIKDTTSIFDLGIDSITALQLSTFFRSRGLGSCSPALLLRNPMVADLSIALSGDGASISTEHLVRESKQTIQASQHRHLALVCRVLKTQPKDIEYIAPCSALQQGILSKSMTSDVRGTYFNSFELDLEEGTSTERLESAWKELVASQAILRTCFVKTADGYIQAALKGQDFPWRELEAESEADIGVITAKARQDWIERNDDHVKIPFELVFISGPGIRRLVIHIFHALYDGNSFDLMMQQIRAKYYEQPTPSAPSFLEALSHGPLWRHDDSRTFWTTHLQNWGPSLVPGLSTPTNGDAILATKVIGGETLEKVRRKHNVTLQSVVMALWTSVLQQYFPDGLSMGVIVAGRSINLENVENTIGPLFNTVPFFNQSLQSQSWESLIRRCHDFNTSILPFQHVPLKSIQKWCSGGRPLFDNLFVFELERNASLDELDLWTIKDGPLNPDYALALEAKRMRGGDVQLSLVAQGHIANAEKLQDILQRVEEGVASMAADEPLQLDEKYERGANQVNSPQDIVNGNVRETDQASFEWTDQALAIRDVVAALADASAEDVTPTRTMLELGLDSIDVIQLSAKLRSKGINLSASSIMRQQTIERMVHSIEIQVNGLQEDSLEDPLEDMTQKLWEYAKGKGIELGDVEAILPPTHLQESMVAGMIHSDFEWYFNHDLLEIASGMNILKLREAWVQVITHSPILRTGFLEIDDRQLDMGYCQIIHKPSTVNIEVCQVASLSEVDQLTQDAKEEAKDKHGVDGLLHIKLVTCQDRSYVLVSIAHALYDGWSLDLLYRDLETAYNGELGTRPTAKLFIRKMIASQTEDESRFWAGYLDGVAPTLVPESREPTSSVTILHRRESASVKKMSAISDFCKKQNITSQTLFQACWAVVLAHRTRTLDITFGVVLSGRDFEGAEDLMFPTINTVPLRCILHGKSSEFLAYLEAVMMDIRDHQAYPLRKIQASAHLSGAELFNTLFILQKVPGQTSSEPLLKSVGGSSAVDYPVCVEAEAVADELIWRVACQAQFLTEAETEELVKDLDHTLQFMMKSDVSEILSFSDERVSICSLSQVALSDDRSNDGPLPKDLIKSEPLDETALSIRKVLAYVSDIPEESIPANASLYHLGLDSISALKVCSLLRKEGININPRDLIKATSFAQMARFAVQRSQDHGQEQSDAVQVWEVPQYVDVDSILAGADIEKEDVDFILPALPMQVYMISAWQNAQGSVFFPEFRYSIDGAYGIERIKSAWESLVAQLPILRTRFLATRSKVLPFIQLALRPGGKALGDDDAIKLVHFNVTEDESGQRAIIRLKIHHALYDGVSLPAMIQQLFDTLQGNSASFEQSTQHWSQFAIQPTLDKARQARRAFWTEYLRNIPQTDNNLTSAGAARVSYLKKTALPDISHLRALGTQHGVGIQSLFFAAYTKTLLAQSANGKQTVVFSIYLANRANEQVPQTYPTLNLVPLKVTAALQDDLVDIAQTIQADLHYIHSESRADVGLWEIAEWTGVAVDSFVNFLSLGQDTMEMSTSPEGFKLMAPSEDKSVDSAEHEGDGILSHNWIRNNMVREAFPVAIDVEASIRDHDLDIGVFGSRRRIHDDEAAKLVEDIVRHLEDIGDR
ncbi:Nonribosomal peptide synthetase 2 [Cladobotryum mycophilum]|uniref:Nonribosomal peptide synthetase 2 n=1 Tax=Cladobotryum mycophilum TaxID=491253 RepID=A0ABR0SWK5_9HYPO